MILIMVLFYYMQSSDNYLLVAPIVPIYGVVIIHLLFKIIIPKEFLYLLELE